jgi:hypothetical protein
MPEDLEDIKKQVSITRDGGEAILWRGKATVMRLSSNLAKANYSNAMDRHNSAFYAFQMCFGASGGSREAR